MPLSALPPVPAAAPTSHSVNTGRSVRSLSLLLLLVFALASIALVHTALRQNAQAAEQRRFLVDKVLEANQRQMETTLWDYASWNASYQNLHISLNTEWAYDRRNMGSSLYEVFQYEGVFVIGPDDRTRYSVIDGKLVDVDLGAWTGADLSALVRKARELAPEEGVVSAFIAIDSVPALVAMAAVGNDSDPTVPLIPGPESVIAWIDRLDDPELQAMGDEYGIEALRHTRERSPRANRMAIDTHGGDSLWLQWEVPRPGSDLLKRLLPLLGLASLVLMVVIRLNLRNAVSAARAIDASYLAAQRYQAQLTFQAQHDPLTGLPNRALLHDRLEDARRGVLEAREQAAVMLLDLDGFKPINDSYGHHFGDQVLVEVGQRLRRLAGPQDTVARLGGDEFVLLMRTTTNRGHFDALAARVLSELSRPYQVENHEFRITASAGLAQCTPELEGPERLLQQADLAMYAAKGDGRNIVQWFSASLDRQACERLNLRNDLHVALDHGQFTLHYQPQLCGRSLRVLGVEALIRWHHPVRGLVSPADFIPLAEETGQIIPMSRWVLDEACRQLRALGDAGYPNLTMAVNISCMHLMRRDFTEDVQRALSAHGVPAERLELEVTESMLLHQLDQAAATLAALRALGVTIAIDDFGTGFSNLGYLRRLPVQRIKIDRSFIAELETSPQDAAIVEGILSLAHKLNLQVIAEGVETAAQSSFLARHQCDGFQGYYFARPMAFEQLRAFLEIAERRAGVDRPVSLGAVSG